MKVRDEARVHAGTGTRLASDQNSTGARFRRLGARPSSRGSARLTRFGGRMAVS